MRRGAVSPLGVPDTGWAHPLSSLKGEAFPPGPSSFDGHAALPPEAVSSVRPRPNPADQAQRRELAGVDSSGSAGCSLHGSAPVGVSWAAAPTALPRSGRHGQWLRPAKAAVVELGVSMHVWVCG